jgi:hypothetical protein
MSRQVLRIHDVPTWQGAGVRQVIATISPGSQTPEITGRMIRAGMNIARLNFSHGEFIGHRQVIENIRTASAQGFRTRRRTEPSVRPQCCDNPSDDEERKMLPRTPRTMKAAVVHEFGKALSSVT